MLDKIIEWDKELFLFLNGMHADWLDPIMLFLSSYLCWIPACLAMLTIIYVKSHSWKKITSLSFLITMGMSALITNIIKVIIERPRPIHNADWQDLLHALEGTSDTSYSFFSSHSATTFSMSVFFALIARKIQLSRCYGYAAIIWAATVSYSRIYVAKHFPLDVLCGILFGTGMGIIGYELLHRFIKSRSEKI
jgi:undecaprenyl-diphosphatase